MPERREMVINTGPLIALIAALGSLDVLRRLYSRVVVPYEVAHEILIANATKYGAKEFEQAAWLTRVNRAQCLPPFLANVLDPGEAAVIHTALTEGIDAVCIDEPAGRRIARLHGLRLTGSLGVLLRAKKEGHLAEVRTAVQRMRDNGIHMHQHLFQYVMKQAGESFNT
jgi:predicted nucleic acid-binding protein